MAMLAVTLLTAFAINASPDTNVKELIRAILEGELYLASTLAVSNQHSA